MKKQESTRIALAETLMQLAGEDPRIALVCADSLKVIKAERFAEQYADRFFDFGISEQNAAASAAGLAAAGLIPFFATYAGFITMRACEQIRTFAAYPGLNVKFVGANGGMSAGEREGVTHQFFEDLGIMRTIAGITVVVPADASQVRQAVKQVAGVKGPAYIRIGSGRDPVIFEEETPFVLGKLRVLKELGQDVTLFACGGYPIQRALMAADQLAQEGIRATVAEVHTLKPLDTEAIAELLETTGAAVTVEDHSIIGGLGSAIAETAGEEMPVPVVRIGLRDTYPESGDPEGLLDRYGIGVADIAVAARKACALKERRKK